MKKTLIENPLKTELSTEEYRRLLFGNDTEIRDEILRSFDFAFNMDWKNPDHHTLFTYLKSLTMYMNVKMFFCHIGSHGIHHGFRFNNPRTDIPNHVQRFRLLFQNESPTTFTEEVTQHGCCIFKI